MSGICVLGAGAFGTALAVAFAAAGRQVRLVARTPEAAARMIEARENRARLPGVAFPETLEVTHRTGDLPGTCLLAVPTQQLGTMVRRHATDLSDRRLVACCKGVDLATGLGPVGVVAGACPSAVPAILSGPGFAADIATGLPTALTLAAGELKVANALRDMLSTPTLRLYASSDVTGVELGGALKNVIAIAAGIAIGSGLGESARAALMTRGYQEMKRLAQAFGARTETLSGLSGFGDLVLTCTSEKSRNYRYGLALGQGRVGSGSATVEGVPTARAVADIAAGRGMDMPITQAVADLVGGKITIQRAVSSLMSRPLREE